MKKLRNKKTGEIGYLIVGRGSEEYKITNDEWDNCGNYNSLAELNEEWEDYEESKGEWYINEDNEPQQVGFGYPLDYIENLRELGLLFETREETERAVEKLKAWNRLKSAGFRFKRYKTIHEDGVIYFSVKYLIYSNDKADLDLLFGGEE